jgi:hypothetical protein
MQYIMVIPLHWYTQTSPVMRAQRGIAVLPAVLSSQTFLYKLGGMAQTAAPKLLQASDIRQLVHA